MHDLWPEEERTGGMFDSVFEEDARKHCASTYPGVWAERQFERYRAEWAGIKALNEDARKRFFAVYGRRDPGMQTSDKYPMVRCHHWGYNAPQPKLLALQPDGNVFETDSPPPSADDLLAYTAEEWELCLPILRAAGKVLCVADSPVIRRRLEFMFERDEALRPENIYVEDFTSSWAIHGIDGIPWPNDAILGPAAAAP